MISLCQCGPSVAWDRVIGVMFMTFEFLVACNFDSKSGLPVLSTPLTRKMIGLTVDFKVGLSSR